MTCDLCPFVGCPNCPLKQPPEPPGHSPKETHMDIELVGHTPCAPSYAHPDDPTREDTP